MWRWATSRADWYVSFSSSVQVLTDAVSIKSLLWPTCKRMCGRTLPDHQCPSPCCFSLLLLRSGAPTNRPTPPFMARCFAVSGPHIFFYILFYEKSFGWVLIIQFNSIQGCIIFILIVISRGVKKSENYLIKLKRRLINVFHDLVIIMIIKIEKSCFILWLWFSILTYGY